jgi:uncharacterized repeat protein (TIGR03803 family)
MFRIAFPRRFAAATLFVLASCAFTFSQTLTVLHTFHGSDGEDPVSGLVLGSDGNLYGTTISGGAKNCGTVFKITQSGKFTSIYSFKGGNDGCQPRASVIRDAAGNLYGTTSSGGRSNEGTVFKINNSGRESVIYAFTGGTDGGEPTANVIRDVKGTLYGTTTNGGIRSCDTPTSGCGTVFKIDSTGKETVLYAFGKIANDGEFPSGNLVMDSSGNLYGTTDIGGDFIEGTLFKVDPSGTETLLHSFNPTTGDGMGPNSLSFAPGGILYGTTLGGGVLGSGTVFTLDPQGNETILYSFANTPDGDGPAGPVARDAAGNLYGVTVSGGSTGCDCGIAYKLDSSGTETILHEFTQGPDGGFPLGRLYVNRQGVVYGTASEGGLGGENGTVFKITQ